MTAEVAVPAGFLKKRVAISSIFLINGLAVGCWAVLVPVIINNLGIAESDMGLMILAGGLAAVAALAVSPAVISALSIRGVILTAGIILSPALYLMLQIQDFWIAVVLVMFVMSALAVQDVAMNADAGELENASARNIMSSFHGFWSAGAMVGALAGGPVLAMLGTDGLTVLVGTVVLLVVTIAGPFLNGKTVSTTDEASVPKTLPRQILPWLFGIIAFSAFISEGAVIDWSARYFRTELASGVALSGLAFGSFSFTMMISRFLGDRMRDAFGDFRLFIGSALIAVAGFLAVVASPSASLAAVGFAFAGLGNANLVPIAFSAASRIRDLPKGSGIAAATFCGYAGLLFAPASLGIIGEYFGFRTVYALMAVLLLVTMTLAPNIRKRTARA